MKISLPISTNEKTDFWQNTTPKFQFWKTGSIYSFVVQVKFLFLIQKRNCPGSGQDRVHFLQ